MQVLSIGHPLRLCEAYCAVHKQWGIYISFPEHSYDADCTDQDIAREQEEILKACPPLRQAGTDRYPALIDGSALLLFDTRKEQQEAYNSIVGDDGPTATNPYNGPMRVYACTISAQGFAENENT